MNGHPLLERAREAARESIDTTVTVLKIASWDEYYTAYGDAWRDGVAAARSFFRLTVLVWRPLVILLGIIGSYIWQFLQVIAQHSLKHLWISAQHGMVQLKYASVWVYNFQRSLSKFAVLCEIGAVAFILMCYVMRRHIRQKKYVERLDNWYRRKKRKVLRKYYEIVRKVSQTSLFLAMLLPHVLYVVFAAGIKLTLPWLVRYFATKTYSIAFISVWYPFVQSVMLLHEYREQDKEHTAGVDPRSPKTPKAASRRVSSPKLTSPLVQRWIRAAENSARKGKRQSTNFSDPLFLLAGDLLRYWVVYATLTAVFRTLYLLPFIARFTGNGSLLASLEEIKLIFFIWLRFFPEALSENDQYKSRPLDLLYDRIVPIAFSMYQSASELAEKTENSSWWVKMTSTLSSVLDVAVMVRLLSKETKEFIIDFLKESAPLLPAAVTLLMPGYFTQFGIVYVQAVVPAAKSFRVNREKLHFESMRFLRYWVLYSLAQLFFVSFGPMLAWVPLSSHATFIFWCFLQLESTTVRWYREFEQELMGFGLMKSHDSDEFALHKVENTATVRAITRITSLLPSASDHGSETKDDSEGVVRADSTVRSLSTPPSHNIKPSAVGAGAGNKDAPMSEIAASIEPHVIADSGEHTAQIAPPAPVQAGKEKVMDIDVDGGGDKQLAQIATSAPVQAGEDEAFVIDGDDDAGDSVESWDWETDGDGDRAPTGGNQTDKFVSVRRSARFRSK